jgi:propanol-preferring alcohol dehydrogenase
MTPRFLKLRNSIRATRARLKGLVGGLPTQVTLYARSKEEEKMKAARLYENETALKLETVHRPVLSSGEAMVRVSATGLCRSDLKILHGFVKPPTYPHIPGHEIAGKLVDARPSNAREEQIVADASKSKTVLVYFYVTCGRCAYCKTNREDLCPSLQRIGWELPGGYAEEVKVPISNLIPTSLGEDAAVLTDAGATVLHALRKAPFGVGTPVLIMGIGGLGAFAVQVAKLMGGEVLALDVRPDSLDLAKKLGADVALDTSHLEPKAVKEALLSKTRGRLPTVFLDLVGNEVSQVMAMSLLAPGGRLLQVGYAPITYSNVPLKDVVYHEFQIMGSLASTFSDLRDIVELVESGKVKLDVTRRYRLEEINGALQDLEQNRINGRALIVP